MKNSTTISAEDLGGCSGCEMSLLQLVGLFLDHDQGLELVHLPLVMDPPRDPARLASGEDSSEDSELPPPPEADIGLISGAVRTVDQLHRARALRRSCRILVAFGTCATHGGIPALANLHSNRAIVERCFEDNPTTDPAPPPEETVPPLLPRTYALDEAVAVDYLLAGCPPPPELIETFLKELATGQAPVGTSRSVCDTCPTRRGEAARAKILIRPTDMTPALQQLDGRAADLTGTRCLLEQGLLCLGPVTKAGCAGPDRAAGPRCPRAGVGCRGCFGPVKDRGNQLLDMLNALISGGVETGDLPDRSGLLRFSGAHGLLKPPRSRERDRGEGQS